MAQNGHILRGKKKRGEITRFRQYVLACHQNITGFLNFSTFLCSQIWLNLFVDDLMLAK
jgi:hypothetical protein